MRIEAGLGVTWLLLACSISAPCELEARTAYRSSIETMVVAQSQPEMFGYFSSSPEIVLEQARQSRLSGIWADSISAYEMALRMARGNAVLSRECVQGLHDCYSAVFSQQPPSILVNGSFMDNGDGTLAEGWTLYQSSGSDLSIGQVTTHVIENAPILKNAYFGGIDAATKIPLCWKAWGNGIEYIRGSYHLPEFVGFVRILNSRSGVYQRVSGLRPGRFYYFGCMVTEGAGRIGVDLTGNTNPDAPTVKWESKPSAFSCVNSEERKTEWRRLLIKAKAIAPTATIFISAANDNGVVVYRPYIDAYTFAHGNIEREYKLANPQFLQEFDATEICGTGSLKEHICVITGIYKQFRTPKDKGLIARVRGFLNSHPGPCSTYFKIGIDPNGGTDPKSETIIWSPERWNTKRPEWEDLFVSGLSASNVATVFVEYGVRSKGFDGYKYHTLLLSDVWVGATDDPLIKSGKFTGIAESMQRAYAAASVGELLEKLLDPDDCREPLRAEVMRLGGRPEESRVLLNRKAASGLCSYQYQAARSLYEYLGNEGSNAEKATAYKELIRMIEAEATPTEESALIRLQLATEDLKHSKPYLAEKLLSDYNDAYLTPLEQIRKRNILATVFEHLGKEAERERALWELLSLSQSYGDHWSFSEAALELFNICQRKKPRDMASMRWLAGELVKLNVSPQHRCRAHYSQWIVDYFYKGPQYYKAAADAVLALVREYPDPHYSPVHLYIGFDLYLRTGNDLLAKATLKRLIEQFPESTWASLASKKAYELGLN